MDPVVTLADVEEAAASIRSYIHRTPLATSRTLDRMASEEGLNLKLFMKCENLQKIGAFKIRGATNALVYLLRELRKGSGSTASFSVITHSSGNHAQALAYASKVLAISCTVVMPSNSASVKKDAVRGYGATVVECIPTLQAREEGVREVMRKHSALGKEMVFVPPYDDVRIIAGQGTLALEMMGQALDDRDGTVFDIIITPVGGGGMLSGCAVAAKGLDPSIWIVGAEPAGADDAYRSFKSKTFVPSVDPQTVADGLRTSLGQITFPLILEYVDAIHTVSEKQIVSAMKLVYERMKLVIEPSSAVTLAVVLYSQEFRESLKDVLQRRGKKDTDDLNIGLVFSGGNVDLKSLSALFELAEKH